MAPPAQPISTSPYFDTNIEQWLVQIDDLRRNPNKGTEDSLRVLFQKSFDHLRDITVSDFDSLTSDEREAARGRSVAAYNRAQNTLIQYSNNVGDKSFDPRQLLNDYAEAYDHYRDGCPVLKTRDLTDVEEAETQTGEWSCPVLAITDTSVNALVGTGFNRNSFHSSNSFYLEVQYSPNDLRQFGEVPDYQTYYNSGATALGWHRDLASKWPSFFSGTGPLVEAGVSVVWGDEHNLGSRRTQWNLGGGWEQHLTRYFFITPQVGVGLAQNWLDFGRGFPLEKETSFMGHVEINGGAEIPLGRGSLSLLLGAGYFYERTLAGEPKYENQGAIVTTALRGGF